MEIAWDILVSLMKLGGLFFLLCLDLLDFDSFDDVLGIVGKLLVRRGETAMLCDSWTYNVKVIGFQRLY